MMDRFTFAPAEAEAAAAEIEIPCAILPHALSRTAPFRPALLLVRLLLLLPRVCTRSNFDVDSKVYFYLSPSLTLDGINI